MSGNRIIIGLLLLLLLSAVILIVLASWSQATRLILSPSPASTPQPANADDAFKERVENYSKRVDELQKVASLLLGLSTIYAIVLAVSAYASVQANLEQAKKSVDQADKSLARLEKLTDKFETDINTEIENLRGLREREVRILQEEVNRIQDRMNYATRVAIATMVSNFPLDQKVVERLQQESIKGLLELRQGNYGTDEFVNLRLARLYRASKQLPSAERAITSFIERKQRSGEGDDRVIEKAYYNRACYRSLQWAATTAGQKERDRFAAGIEADLREAISLSQENKEIAKGDSDFDAVKNEPWFQQLIKN